MAKNSMASATLPAEKLRLAKSRMSSIGSSRRSSQRTNMTPAIAATMKIMQRRAGGPAAPGGSMMA